MRDVSLIEKMGVLVGIIVSSPLSLFCSTIGVILLIYYLITIKKNIKINKFIFIAIWCVLLGVLVINYRDVVFAALDKFFDGVFEALYFPNISIYTAILIITNGFFFYSIFSKKMEHSNKLLNFISALIVDLLLILVIDLVQQGNLNVYEQLTIYSNSKLLVLLELTSALFVSWLLLNLLLSALRKLRKYDKKEYPIMPEIVFEDIR